MEITHHTRNLRIAPRKLRLVIDTIRHTPAQKAVSVLRLTPRKGADIAFKSLQSAIQVAKDRDLDVNSLTIQQVWCDEGTSLKRMVSHSRGRMSRIMKKYSHLSIVLTGEPAAKRSTRKLKPKTEPTASEPEVTPVVSENLEQEN